MLIIQQFHRIKGHIPNPAIGLKLNLRVLNNSHFIYVFYLFILSQKVSSLTYLEQSMASGL